MERIRGDPFPENRQHNQTHNIMTPFIIEIMSKVILKKEGVKRGVVRAGKIRSVLFH